MSDVLFSGCTVRSRLPFIEGAFRFILNELGKDMDELRGSTCCMEPVGLRSMSQDSWLAVNARIHSIAKGNRIVTLCEGCNLSLSESGEILKGDKGKKAVDIVSGLGYQPRISDVAGTLEFLYENLSLIKERIKVPLKKHFAFFPGCHCEFVCSKKGRSAILMMEEVLKAIGSVPLRPAEDLCCGGGVSMIDAEIDKNILTETIKSFTDMSADPVVTACPFCFMRFDMVAKYRTYHVAEIVAMAMGHEDTMKYHTSKQP